MGREVLYRFLNEGDLQSADLILANRWPVPRFTEAELPVPLTWEEDPFNEQFWRFTFYGLRPLRHLVWAWRTTGDDRYRDKLHEVLESFIERGHQSPHAWDKHTAAYRAMSLVNIYFKLKAGNALPPQLEQGLRERISELGHFLQDPKNFEDDYNHGLAEAGALLLIAENFPELEAAPTWRATALTRLDGLLDRVLDQDGVEVEQSPFYHFYVLVGFWEIYHWASENQVLLSSQAERRIYQMIRYATYITLPNGDVPMIGASVARNVRKSQDTPLYEEMAALDPHFKYVLLAGKAGSPPLERHMLFPSSGQAVLRSSFGTAKDFLQQTHLIFDVGPYRTNHSHLDALSVHLYSAGRVLLPDSGLFSYEAGPDHDYFHGTRAHNTVVVDGKDQRKGSARAGLSASGDEGWAYQSGVHELYDDVQHRRAVLLLKRDLVLVVDDLAGSAPHTYEQTWHLPPSMEFQTDGARATAVDAGSGRALLTLHQALLDGVTLSSYRGSTEPMDGWYSEKYESKTPAWALRYRQEAAQARYVTLLASGELATAPLQLTAQGSAQGMLITVCIPAGQSYRVALSNLAESGESVLVEPLSTPCGSP